MRRVRVRLLALSLFLAHGAGLAATVSGSVSIESRKGNADPSGALVWLEGGPAPAPRHGTIRHNVFSLSEDNPFDLELYEALESLHSRTDR